MRIFVPYIFDFDTSITWDRRIQMKPENETAPSAAVFSFDYFGTNQSVPSTLNVPKNEGEKKENHSYVIFT